MANVEERCQWINQNIANSVDKQPFSAVLALGALLCLKSVNDNDIALINKTICELPYLLNKNQINILWKATNIAKENWELMENGTRRSILKVKKAMLSFPGYFLELDNELIIAQNRGHAIYRYALIALIRKAMWPKDVFSHFDFTLLNKAAPSQDAASLQPLFMECHSLPLNEIISLGEDPEIAKLILMDLASHKQAFELETLFAKKHPSLRASIAGRWQSHFQHFPLSLEQSNFVNEALITLRQYPEFAPIRVNSRLPRVFERASGVTSLFWTVTDYLKQLFTEIVELNDTAANDCVEFLSDARTYLPGLPWLNNTPRIKPTEPSDDKTIRYRR